MTDIRIRPPMSPTPVDADSARPAATAGCTSVATAVRAAAVRASRAPSVHNTQPWTFVVRDGVLDVHADDSRRLAVLDPRGRQSAISLGCAVLNARVSLAAAGFGAEVTLLPYPDAPDLVAEIVARPGRPADPVLAALEPAIERRQTNRRRFGDQPVPDHLADRLVAAAAAEGARLFPVVRDEHRLAVARLSQLADSVQQVDPRYRGELRAWMTDDPGRLDGVSADAVPLVGGPETTRDEVPLRHFDATGVGSLPSTTASSSRQCLFVLGTLSDSHVAWLQAGQALERVWLELTAAGCVASPLTQVIEVPRTHALLRAELGLGMTPHLLLRVGHAEPTPFTRRRRLVDVLIDENG